MTNEISSLGIRSVRLAVVQPVMSPVRRPVFELMAQNPNLTIRVFLLSETLPNRPGWTLKEEEKLDVKLVGARRRVITGRTPGGREATDYRFYSAELVRAIRAWRADAVLFGGTALMAHLLPLKFAYNTKLIIAVADTPVTAAQYSPWWKALRATLYRQADAYVPYGNAGIVYLRSIGVSADRIFHGRHAVDNSLYDCSSQHSDSQGSNIGNWITVGQLVPRKGLKELIAAWARQKSEFLQQNKLWIVGEGRECANIISLINHYSLNGHVSVLGHKEPEELAIFYNQACVFIFPTLMDHWGLVVNEAMASGLPVLCSKYAGCHADLVRPGNAMLFDPLDPDGFAAALSSFWNKRDQWTEMGRASREIIASYNFQAMVDARLNAVQRALGCLSFLCQIPRKYE